MFQRRHPRKEKWHLDVWGKRMYFFDVRIESVSDMTEKNGAEVPGYSPETYICIHFPMLMVVFCFENMFTMRVSMMISIILYWAQTNKIILNGLFGYIWMILDLFAPFWAVCFSTAVVPGASCQAPDGSGSGGEGATSQRGATLDEWHQRTWDRWRQWWREGNLPGDEDQKGRPWPWEIGHEFRCFWSWGGGSRFFECSRFSWGNC